MHYHCYYRIDENGIIKIADFGLTEDIYTKCYFNQFTDKNESSKNIKLPVKWMAIESLCDGIFSEKSDVVSTRPAWGQLQNLNYNYTSIILLL